jgi:hypothetical protein
MWYLVVVVIVLAGLLAGFAGMFKGVKQNSEQGKNLNVDHRLRVMNPLDSIHGSYTRAEIRKKLIKLASSVAPVSLKRGAMCYDMAGPPERAEYVCPVCGEKTIYTLNQTSIVQYEIPSCRQQIKSIQGLDIRLDESQYCHKCHPEVTEPSLCILIKYINEEKPYECCSVSSDDIELIYEFMKGDNKHLGDRDAEYPLKNYANRLEQLLGVNIE